jgi:translation elongation factor EF-Tu-like GTPase
MVTGASTADLAVLLIDARKGILPQTRRHAAIASLLGIRQVILAVNKMDLVGFEEAVFASIRHDFRALLGKLEFDQIQQPLEIMGWTPSQVSVFRSVSMLYIIVQCPTRLTTLCQPPAPKPSRAAAAKPYCRWGRARFSVCPRPPAS